MTNDDIPLEMAIAMTGEHFRFHSSFRGPKARFGFTWTLAPGKKGPPEHVHPAETESFRIISGTLRVFVRDVAHDVGPGESLAVPPGTPHRFFNPGTTPVVVEVELDGRALEDAMIPASLHLRAVGTPRTKDFARMLVTDVVRRGSVPTSGILRALLTVVCRALEAFGVRAFDPVDHWERI